MLVDPWFASWVQTGSPQLPGTPTGADEQERFAAYERVVMERTNALNLSRRRLSPPWPRALGTPPWGARRELELGAARRGARYAVDLLRIDRRDALVGVYDHLVDVVAEGEPALLYVGNDLLPRHVVLVLPGDGDRVLDVYEPAAGLVRVLRRDEFTGHALALAGWDVPWFVVRPTGERTVRVREGVGSAAPTPA